MDLAERLRQQAVARPEIALAVLFGSAARGEAGPRSDVDLGILLEPYDPALRLEIEGQLGRAAGRPLDMVLLDEAPPLLRFEITRDGVLLFERRPHLWTDFKVKAMLDWWDWAPTARAIQRTMIQRLREKVGHGPA